MAYTHGQQPGDYSHSDADGRAAEFQRMVYERLRGEMIDALLQDPARHVETPQWPSIKSQPAYVSVCDDAGKANKISLMQFVARCTADDAPTEIRMRANALIATLADEFAAY